MNKKFSKLSNKKIKEKINLQEQKEELFSDLDLFCDQVSFDDINFSTWKQSNISLDLRIPIFLTKEEASPGLKKTISYSKTVYFLNDNGTETFKREKVNLTVVIGPKAQNDDTIVLNNRGDSRGKQKGKLILVLKVRK